jgi:adenine-specific DNA-methyltransferase
MAKRRKKRFSPVAVSTAVSPGKELQSFKKPLVWNGSVESFLDELPDAPLFDLVITSPPYNIGKVYETREAISKYLAGQKKILKEVVARLRPKGSLCWQVGNFLDGGEIVPLDFEFHKIIRKLGLKLRNRIVWRFGHGLHASRRFSGRYEVILWYTKTDRYTFNLDPVRIPAKYPAKRSYKGKNKGKYSSHPLGKNPEDVWDIPNVKGNHIEKTIHPCQFPVGLVERLVLALSKSGDLVFDPFAGAFSTGVGALLHGRRFVGCEKSKRYCDVGRKRLEQTLAGKVRYRPHDKPIYDHLNSKLSIAPKRRGRSRRSRRV